MSRETTDEMAGLINKALYADVTDPEGVLRKIATSPLAAQNGRDEVYSLSRPEYTVRENLSSTQRTYLQNTCYPHLNLSFSATANSDHGMAAARRSIEQELAVRSCNMNKTVVDVGGNWRYHLLTGHDNVHCCCPLIDVRDAARQTKRSYEAEKWAIDKTVRLASTTTNMDDKQKDVLRRVKSFLAHPKATYCQQRSQFCTVKATTALFLDSLYDVSINDLPKILDAHQCEKGYGYIIFSPEMLVEQSGYVLGMDCHWRREKRKHVCTTLGVTGVVYEEEVIRYTFRNGSAWEYVHNYASLVRIATIQHLRGAESCYAIERKWKEGLLHFEIYRVGKFDVPNTLSFSFWREKLEGKTLVRLIRYDGIGGRIQTGLSTETVYIDTGNCQRLVVGFPHFLLRVFL